MKKLIFMFVCGLFMTLSFTSIQAVTPSPNCNMLTNEEKEDISSQINILMKKYQTPGLAVALVDDSGVIWQQGFGITGDKLGQLVSPETLFSLESQTKMFTALGVMLGVQSGMLDLNVPIKRYLPDLNVYSVYEKDPGDKITLKHLLSHTAGFAHEAPIGNNYNSQASFNEHMKSILVGTWLQFPVGQEFNYSNVGIDLAGYILQVKSKKSYIQYMNENVLKPLNMDASTFDIKQYLVSANHAVGHINGLKEVPINYSILAAGGLYSSVADMANYLIFQLNDGKLNNKQILSKPLLDIMLTIPYPKINQIQGGGLGIWKGTRLNTTYYSHLGRGFGFAGNLEWYPEYHIGIVVLTNKYDTSNVDIKISHLIIDKIINKKIKDAGISIENKMVGNYISSDGNIEILQDKKLSQVVLKGPVNWGPIGNNITIMHSPLEYIGQNNFYCKQDKQTYHFITSGLTGVPTIMRINDGYTWYLNDSKNELYGPNKLLWKKYLGTYILHGYGPDTYFHLHLSNGYLYINNLKLREYQPGIFSTADGEMLVFNEGHITFANLPLVDKRESF